MPTPPLTLARAAADLRRGAVTAADLVEAALDAIAAHGERTNAFTFVDAAAARRAARRADDERGRGLDRGPLHGMPFSIKDLIDVEGWPTTAASDALPRTAATRDAPLIETLRAAGAVLLGKTNLHEFALGTTSDESAFGPVRHPADPQRSAGGSSGGSAAAVATGMGLASIGTDTGGSIRIPSSACGIVGLKPGFGEISLDGVVPLSKSFDHAGPIARTVEDAALIWTALTGVRADGGSPDPGALRLGVLRGVFDAPLAPEVREAWSGALDVLAAAGARLHDVRLDGDAEIASAYVDIALPEAAAWHDAHVGAPADRYTPGVAARLSRGRDIPAVRYLAAQAFRVRLRQAVDAALGAADALVTPTLPILPPPLGAESVTMAPGGPAVPVRAAMLKHTQPFNLTGHPAISIPLPTSGLPMGLQLVGRSGATAALLAVAAACERALGLR